MIDETIKTNTEPETAASAVDPIVHTPGPWRAFEDQDGLLYVETDQSRGNQCSAIICQVGAYPMQQMSEPERHRADARLIAAAQDMKATIERVLHFATGNCDMIPTLRLACIAKECKATLRKVV